MGRFAPEALRQLGHTVQVFNHENKGLFQKILKKTGNWPQYINAKLLREVEAFRPDLFFCLMGREHNGPTLLKLKEKGIYTALWWLNDPFMFSLEMMPWTRHFDVVFANGSGRLQEYRDGGVVNAYFLPVGIDPKVHYPTPETVAEKPYDVLMAGDWHVLREELLTQLHQLGFRLAIMGPWHRRLKKDSPLHACIVHRGFFTPEQMAEAYRKTKIVLNLHTWMGKFPHGVNPRLFEAAACGAFQLVDRKREIEQFFTDGKDLVIFDDLTQLKELITYWLQHDTERAEMGRHAAQTASTYTYVQRMREMLYYCGMGPKPEASALIQ
jgi:spore maturation protein CgeB